MQKVMKNQPKSLCLFFNLLIIGTQLTKTLLPPKNELTTKTTQLKGIGAPNKHN